MFFHYYQSNQCRFQNIKNKFRIVENRHHNLNFFNKRKYEIDNRKYYETNVKIF